MLLNYESQYFITYYHNREEYYVLSIQTDWLYFSSSGKKFNLNTPNSCNLVQFKILFLHSGLLIAEHTANQIANIGVLHDCSHFML